MQENLSSGFANNKGAAFVIPFLESIVYKLMLQAKFQVSSMSF